MEANYKHSHQEEYQPGSLPEVFQLVDAAAKKLRHIQTSTMRRVHLTPPQYFTLSLLWAQDGRALKELAQALACSRATMTGVIDTLEKKKLVERRPNPLDRRSLLVCLTEAGAALQESTGAMQRMFGQCCTGLPNDEVQGLSVLLKKLNDMLGCSIGE